MKLLMNIEFDSLEEAQEFLMKVTGGTVKSQTIQFPEHRKVYRSWKRWSPEELEFVASHHKTMTAKEVGKSLSRSHQAVSQIIDKMMKTGRLKPKINKAKLIN